jgi:uncharacterized protein YyaL (SSP411 family)
MLYDNGQLASLYLHAYQMFGTPLYRRIAEETLAYLQREMLDPSGGFYSSQDADSEGEEGKFFVWTPDEIDEVLTPEEARVFKSYYGVTASGNFEGANIPWLPRDPDVVAANLNLSERVMEQTLARARQKLFQKRAERVAPGTDTKVLVSWNALAITAFAEASRTLDNPQYGEIAARAASFILDTMRRPDGHLLRTWKAGSGGAKLNAYLEDYAYLINALTYLYEATFDERWLREARELAEIMFDEFWDPKGGFYDTGSTHEELVLRPKDVVDNAMPSGNAMAAQALLRLGAFLNEERYVQAAHRTLQLVGPSMAEQPLGFGQWLVALDGWLTPTMEFALVGEQEEVRPFTTVIYERFLPNKIVVHATPDEVEAKSELIPLLQAREARGGKATAYLCENFACQQPVTDPEELAEQIEQVFA